MTFESRSSPQRVQDVCQVAVERARDLAGHAPAIAQVGDSRELGRQLRAAIDRHVQDRSVEAELR